MHPLLVSGTAAVVLAACATSPPAPSAPGQTWDGTPVLVQEPPRAASVTKEEVPPPAGAVREFPWQRLADGIEILETVDWSSDVGRPLLGSAARIDLTTPGLEIVTTPGNGGREGETDGQRTTTFLKTSGSTIAINAAPFSPIHLFEGKPQDIVGLHIAGGETVSPANHYPAIIFRGNRARISASSTAEGAHAATAGFGIVLQDGVPRGDATILHPRTAAGVSRDGRTLTLLVLDGRQPTRSEGASEQEVGAILKDLGADDGINLDGGGTTAMALKSGAGVRLANRPINGGIPGLERVAASHLGVRLR